MAAATRSSLRSFQAKGKEIAGKLTSRLSNDEVSEEEKFSEAVEIPDTTNSDGILNQLEYLTAPRRIQGL